MARRPGTEPRSGAVTHSVVRGGKDIARVQGKGRGAGSLERTAARECIMMGPRALVDGNHG